MEVNNTPRVTLGGKISAILVAAGGSVGLGHIWRFPYVAGENGGGAFLIVYLACVVLLGLPIMLSEFTIGRESKRNAVGSFRMFDKRWTIVGYNSILIAVLIMGFYFVVSGWTAEYFINSITGKLSHLSTSEEYTSFFENFVANPWTPVLYAWGFIAVNHLIILVGVKKGIERSSKLLMPILFLILIVMSVKSLLMPGAWAGVEFLFKPDFSKITFEVVLEALGQAFFSLSIGLGSLITYASYFNDKTNLTRTATSVMLVDTFVAVIAGVMIFPAVFSMGIEPTSGPSLVFITLPSILNSLPLSVVWSTVFFLLLVIAALTSTISLHEVVTLYLHEEWGISRGRATTMTSIVTGLLAAVASLSLGMWSEYRVGGLTFFDLLDYVTANIMLPLGGLAICIFTGWVIDREIVKRQISNYGVSKARLLGLLLVLIRYVCPVVLLLIFLNSIGII